MAVWSVASTGHPFLLSKLAYQAIRCPRKRGRLSITSERFSKRKMDLLDASREVVGFVESTYPDLSDRAMSFYYCNLVYLFSLVQANDVRARYTEEHQLLRTLFHREFPAMITNPYLDIPRKAMAALMRLRLYDPVRKIWKGLRRA
jgi:hypothetical protein